MARKNRTPEENARREKIRELLQMANIGSMEDIQSLFKETIAEFMENGLEAELDDELGYSKYDYKNKDTDNSRNRALMQIADYGCRLNIDAAVSPDQKVKEFISYLPVLAYDGNMMRPIDAEDILDYAMSGTSATLLARRWESPLLVNVDDDTLKRLISITKHGLKIPVDTADYDGFAAKMKNSENEFIQAFSLYT